MPADNKTYNRPKNSCKPAGFRQILSFTCGCRECRPILRNKAQLYCSMLDRTRKPSVFIRFPKTPMKLVDMNAYCLGNKIVHTGPLRFVQAQWSRRSCAWACMHSLPLLPFIYHNGRLCMQAHGLGNSGYIIFLCGSV